MTDRYTPGETVEGIFALADFSLANYSKPQRQGQRYLRLTLLDTEGRIEGRLWENWEGIYESLQSDSLYRVRGTVSVFNGSQQISVQELTPLPPGTADLAAFQPRAPVPLEPLREEFARYREMVEKPTHKVLLAALFDEETLALFERATAATKHHHAYRGGLLHHTVEVLRLVEAAIGLPGYGLDPDLLLTGAILHDFGKLEEYDHDSVSFRRRERTRLIGTHVLLGARTLDQAFRRLALNFPAEEQDRLIHLVLSHHGTPEWGSPVAPRLPEAVALHQADLFSTRLNQAGQREEPL